MAEPDGFLGRWSRRKAAARQGLPEQEEAPHRQGSAAPVSSDGAAAPPVSQAAGESPAAEEETEAQVLARLELPDIETLTYESDFTAFMRAEVPERIRRRALRKLWRSNPVLANLDGLNDYDEDYTDAAVAAEGLKTLYRVGRGMIDALETVEDNPADLPPEGTAGAAGKAAATSEEAGPEWTDDAGPGQASRNG